MGLGKTCQVCLAAYFFHAEFILKICCLLKVKKYGSIFQSISFLLALCGGENVKGQHLILSPLSVLNNWLNELTR